MMKFLSLLLSFSLIFTSLVPSYAEAASSVSRQKALIESQISNHIDHIDQAVRAQVRNGKFAVADKVSEVKAVVKALTEGGTGAEAAGGELTYEDFSRAYESGMKEVLAVALGEAKTEEERSWVKGEWDKMMSATGRKAAYSEYRKTSGEVAKAAEEEARIYLKQLGREIIAVYKANRKAGLELITEALPVFTSVGAIDAKVKAQGAAALRGAVNAGAKSCGSVGFISGIKARLGRDGDVKEQAKACQGVIEQALALSVLGEDSEGKINADAEALSNLLAQGYNGIMGPAVIMSVSRGLLAMNGERALTAELVKISRQMPDVGLFGNDFSFLSVGDWVKFATTLKGDYAIGSEYSFYQGEKANLKNAWIDLGMYLAQAGGKGGKYVLDVVVKDSVWYDSYGNAGVKFKPFVTGALAGGYRIEKGGAAYDALDANGKAYRVDTRAAYGKAKGVMDKLGINESGYFALSLYYSGKDDIDPYTRVYVNNLLVSGYKQSGNSRSFKGFETRIRPTAQEVSRYGKAQTAQKIGQGVDLALVLVFGTKLLVSAVKLGVQGMKSGVRILKLARAGQAANGLGYGKNLSRVVRLGRLQKYGVSSAKELARMRLASVTGVQQTKLTSGVRKVRAQNIRQMAKAREAAKAQQAARAKAAQEEAILKSTEVRAVDGQAYLVPEGMDVVRVQGRPVYVEKGLSRAEVAKRFNVSEEMVAPAANGSWGIEPAAARYATTGDGAAVTAKAQPVMDGPKVVTVEGGVTGPKELPVRYEQVPVKNALGNEVMSWRAVEEPAAVKKVGFVEGLKEKALWYWSGAEQFANGVGSAARSKFGSTALAMSMNLSSAPIQAVKAEASLLAKGVKTEHMLKLKDIVWFSEEARGGLGGASHAIRGVNRGAVANMNARPLDLNLSSSKVISLTPEAVGAAEIGNAAIDLKENRAFKPADIKESAVMKWLREKFVDNGRDELSPSAANKIAKNVLAKKNPLSSSLVAIVRSPASAENKGKALLALYDRGVLAEDLKVLPQRTRALIESSVENRTDLGNKLLALYHLQAFENALSNVDDGIQQVPLSAGLKKLMGTTDWEAKVQAAYAEEAQVLPLQTEQYSGMVPTAPKLDMALVKNTWRGTSFAHDNAYTGQLRRVHWWNFFSDAQEVFYKNNIPFYYRYMDGTISDGPVGILSYKTMPGFYNKLLSLVGLSSNVGFSMPEGYVLVLDEEGKWKYAMPRGNLAKVESNKYSRRYSQPWKKYPWSTTLQPRKSARVAVDTPYSTTDLLTIANLLETQKGNLNVELELNKPNSLKQFLTFHALFVGNDAGQTLTGPFKDTVKSLDGAWAWLVNTFGGIGYTTPFFAGKLMGFMSRIGHSATILGVYGFALVALLYSFFGLGMDGSFVFPKDADWWDYVALGIPTTTMVLGGSLLNTSTQTLLNFYKDPVARTGAHLNFANNKNYSRLAIALLTFGAFVSGLKIHGETLNWSVVVPAAIVLLTIASLLYFNTPVFEQDLKALKNRRAENQKKAAEEAKKTDAERAAEAEAAKKEAEFMAQLQKENQKWYKSEFRKMPEVKEIAGRVSKVYASYAASLLVLGQALTEVGKKVVVESPSFTTFMQNYLPFVNLDAADAGKALGMLLTALCLLTTTKVRGMASNWVKNNKATDDQLTGASLLLLPLATAALVVMPSDGPWALASLGVILALYAATAVPGQLDAARMQNYISSIFKKQKLDLQARTDLTPEQKAAEKKKLEVREKFASSKGAALYSYMNGCGLIGIGVTVLGVFLMQDLASIAGSAWQNNVLDTVTSLVGSEGESHSIAFSRLVLAYAAAVAGWLAWTNRHLIADAKELVKPLSISPEAIAAGKINASTFGINQKNARMRWNAVDKEIDDIASKIIAYGSSSEQKVTGLFNSMVVLNNRLQALSEILGEEGVAASIDKLRTKIVVPFTAMIRNNDLSAKLKKDIDGFSQMFFEKDGVTPRNPARYIPEGTYSMPKNHELYETGSILVNEIEQLAYQVTGGRADGETYALMANYYTRASRVLNAYLDANRDDEHRVRTQFDRLTEVANNLKALGLKKANPAASDEDVEKLTDILDEFTK